MISLSLAFFLLAYDFNGEWVVEYGLNQPVFPEYLPSYDYVFRKPNKMKYFGC